VLLVSWAKRGHLYDIGIKKFNSQGSAQRDTANLETVQIYIAMAPRGGREKETPLPLELAAFRDLVAACNERLATENQ